MGKHIVARLAVAICCLGATCCLAQEAGKVDAGKVGAGTGVLAVATEPAGPWSVRELGEPLPNECLLRTAGSGSRRVEFGRSSVVLRPNTVLRLNAERREIQLARGQALVQIDGRASWNVVVRVQDTIELTAETLAELNAVEPVLTTVAVIRGSAVHKNGTTGNVQALGRQMQLTWHAGQENPRNRITELSDEDANRIAAEPPTALSQGLGQLVVKANGTNQPTRLNVAHYHVNVVLKPPMALVQIDQSFYNPFATQQEGTYVFNLPDGASVSRFAMYTTPDRLIEGEMIERKQASNIYESIVRSMRDPAILEQIGDNLFKMRVFPIFASDTKRILLDYTVPLVAEDGTYRFQLPLASDLEPVADFKLTGRVIGPKDPNAVRSLSHPDLKFLPHPDGSFRFEFQAQNYPSQTDLQVQFTRPQEPGIAVRRFSPAANPPSPNPAVPLPANVPAAQAKRDNYFLATITLADPEQPAPAPTDVLILADTSSSMRELHRVQQVMETVVHQLRPVDRFQVVCVDAAPRPLTEQWITPGTPEQYEVLRRFAQEFPLGETNLQAGFQAAVKRFDAARDRRRVLLYVGDGRETRPGLTTEIVRTLLAKSPNRQILGCVAFVKSAGQSLPDDVYGMAQSTGGQVFRPGAEGQRRLFAWVLGGMPSGERILSVTAPGSSETETYFSAVRHTGQTLDVLGRAGAEREFTLKVVSEYEGQAATRTYQVSLESAEKDLFVGRLWAHRRLKQLQQQETTQPEEEQASLRQSIVDLSQKWSLLSPHTAFLVLETEADYKKWGIDRRDRHRYWKTSPRLAGPSREWITRVITQSFRPGNLLRQDATRPGQPRQGPLDAAEVRELDDTVMAALHRSDINSAMVRLHRALTRDPQLDQNPEYRRLATAVSSAAGGETLLGTLGTYRRLFDPRARQGGEWPDLAASQLLAGGFSRDFLASHPHAEPLLRRFPGPDQSLTVEALAEQLEEWTGANVILNRKELEDEGIELKSLVQLEGLRGRSLRNVLSDALAPLSLALVDQRYRLLITTRVTAEEMITPRVYPVGDLTRPNRAPDLSLLSDPYLDCDQAATARIEAKLKRPNSFGFKNSKLADVVKALPGILDDNVRLNVKALEDEGLNLDTPITAQWRDVPLAESLHWMLDPLGLDYVIRGESLVITTKDDAEEILESRLYSGRGLVAHWPEVEFQTYSGPLGGNIPPKGGAGGGAFGGGGGGGLGAGGGGFFGPTRSETGANSGNPSAGDATNGGVSVSGDGEAPTSTESPVSAPIGDEVPSGSAVGGFVGDPWKSGGGVQADGDSIIELITSTVDPSTWDEVGGRGSMQLWPYSLDFVVSTTDRTHRRVEQLFRELRGVPLANGQGDWTPALDPVGDGRLWDSDSLSQLITDMVSPQKWDEVGGRGSLQPFEYSRSLAISADAETHQGVRRLLTLLRRSNYARLHADRPWVSLNLDGRRVWDTLGGPNLPGAVRLADLPAPRASELAALAIRREPAVGSWKWRRTHAQGEPSDEVMVRRSAQRLEFDWAGRVIRLEGQQAALGYPGLTLVEFGPWADEVRGMADAFLPLLSHRTNEELARLFEVRLASPETAATDLLVEVLFGIEPALSAPGLITLPPDANSDKSFLRVIFARDYGLPTLCEAFVNGRFVMRYRFDKLTGQGAQAYWRTITLEDAAGQQVERWELLETDSVNPEIPAIHEGWAGYVRLDSHGADPAVPRNAAAVPGVENVAADNDPIGAVRALFAAIRRHEWQKVQQALEPQLAAEPHQPLLRLLRAWCYDRDRTLGSRAAALADLRAVIAPSVLPNNATVRGAQSSWAVSAPLPRFIADGSFSFLSPQERYELLSLAPKAGRNAEDERLLAELALTAHLPEPALEHVAAAFKLNPTERNRFRLELLRVDLLLRSGKPAQAIAAAQAWAKSGNPLVDQLIEVADRLIRHGQLKVADELLAQATNDPRLTVSRKFALIQQRANLHSELSRWQLLLSGIEALPADSPLRHQGQGLLLTEVAQAADANAAQALAAIATDPQLKILFLTYQAQLTLDRVAAAEIYWKLHESRNLAPHLINAACESFEVAEKPDRTVRLIESQLRSGQSISAPLRVRLCLAYAALGRTVDAQRANTEDR